MSTSILYTPPTGVAGDIRRQQDTQVETILFDATNPPTVYGKPYKIASGEAEAIEASDTAADFAGILVRRTPRLAAAGAADDTPDPDQTHGGATKGFVVVSCGVGTPARGGAVYMRVQTDTGKAIGDLEATSDIDVTAGDMVGTGNATAGTLSATQDAQEGDYVVTMTGATAFTVTAPDGTQLKAGATGSAYTAGGLTFTVTVGGTGAEAGDTITITVEKQNVLLPGVTWAVDGKGSDNLSEIRIA